MCSVLEAYQNKYEDDFDPAEAGGDQVTVVFVKRKHFKLTNLVLDNCGITTVGTEEKLAGICTSVTECDLSHNKISSWQEVVQLLELSPRLQFLCLSNNALGVCQGITPAPSYPTLTSLILLGTLVTWENLVSTVLPCLPGLTTLNIGHNGLTSLRKLSDSYTSSKMQNLNLIENSIREFAEVAELAEIFPNLTTLILSENPLLSFGEDQEAVAKFAKLSKLHINNIAINSWADVSKLRWFPALQDVRMVHWDLFGEMNEEERRLMLGALLPTIPLINGAPIHGRDAAERWYLRRCAGNPSIREDQRVAELEEKHGVLPELRDISLKDIEEEKITLSCSVPEKGILLERSFSVYDTYSTVIQSLEEELRMGLSINRVQLRKKDDSTVYSLQRGPELVAASEPGVIKIISMTSMLYQVFSGVRPLAQAENGDCLELKRASPAEIKFDAAHGHKRRWL